MSGVPAAATLGACTAPCWPREAIVAANTDAAFGGCAAGSGDDIVTVAPFQIYTLNGAQLPVITTTVTITGDVTQIRAAAEAGRVLHGAERLHVDHRRLHGEGQGW